MDKTFLKLIDQPKIENPILIEGLPGFGNVGRLTANLFIEFMAAKRFAELYSPFFPDYVVIDSKGVCRPPRYEFYHAKSAEQDFLILTGDTQPALEDINAHYELCDEILDFAEKFGCQTIITIGGVPVPQPTRQIYVAATSTKLASEPAGEGATIYGQGRIMGATGILLGLAKIRGWTGICLLGATTGLKADQTAALSVFRFLIKLLGLEEKKGL